MDDRWEWRILSAFHTVRSIAWWPTALDHHRSFFEYTVGQHRAWIRGAAPGLEPVLGSALVAAIVGADDLALPAACSSAADRLRAAEDWLHDFAPDVAFQFDGTGAPVACTGAASRFRFRFRARGLGWTFRATGEDVDPTMLDGPDDCDFYREDDDSFGADFEPSWLTARQTQLILVRYIDELAAKGKAR